MNKVPPSTGTEAELIYDWNQVLRPASSVTTVELDDETLRDGIQSPSVRAPSTAEKIELLHLMADLGIHAADIGLPGAGPRVQKDVVALAKEIAHHRLPIAPNCAARTLAVDIQPIVDASQAAGISIEASLFIGSSPIRQYVEGWTIERMLQMTEESIRFCVDNGLSVMFVTEDTTRSQPDTLRKLYATAIACGARRVCAADTVGHADAHGTRMLIGLMREIVTESGESVKIDWHGHRDRGLSLENALAAACAGADRVHGTALGIGERCGNTPMEHLLINFRVLGLLDNDLSRLGDYCAAAARACAVPIPNNHPVIGADAYRTSTGVHAAAVIKAIDMGHEWLADRIYSGVPARWTGRQQQIEIGPMSGASNVIYWLRNREIAPDDALVARIFEAAKNSDHVFTDDEVLGMIRDFQSMSNQ